MGAGASAGVAAAAAAATADELKKAMAAMPADVKAKLVSALDGVVEPSKNSEASRMNAIAAEEKAAATACGSFSLFAKLDTDKNGSVDGAELSAALKSDDIKKKLCDAVGLSPKTPVDELADAIMKKADTNTDRKIQAAEFEALLKGWSATQFEKLSPEEIKRNEDQKLAAATARAEQTQVLSFGFIHTPARTQRCPHSCCLHAHPLIDSCGRRMVGWMLQRLLSSESLSNLVASWLTWRPATARKRRRVHRRPLQRGWRQKSNRPIEGRASCPGSPNIILPRTRILLPRYRQHSGLKI